MMIFMDAHSALLFWHMILQISEKAISPLSSRKETCDFHVHSFIDNWQSFDSNTVLFDSRIQLKFLTLK